MIELIIAFVISFMGWFRDNFWWMLAALFVCSLAQHLGTMEKDINDLKDEIEELRDELNR